MPLRRTVLPPSPDENELWGWCERLRWAVTESRIAILRAVLAMQGYLTADEIAAAAQAFHPRVSRATVYRALPQLCGAGLLRKTDVGEGPQRFSRQTPGEVPSAEIVVEDCGLIVKVPAPFLSWYANAITVKAGLKLTGHRLQTFARCERKIPGKPCADCPRTEQRSAQISR